MRAAGWGPEVACLHVVSSGKLHAGVLQGSGCKGLCFLQVCLRLCVMGRCERQEKAWSCYPDQVLTGE